MNLKSKSNEILLTDTDSLRKLEIENIADLLMHLREVEERKLDLLLGYNSVYEFCRERLGYDRNAAYYRICAVQCLKLGSEVEQALRTNKLSLSSLQLAHVTFESEDARRKKAKEPKLTTRDKLDALNEIAHASVRDARKVLAARFPQADKNEESTKPITGNLTTISFSATDEEMADFEWLKNQFAHTNYSGKWQPLFAKLARDTRARMEREQRRTEKPVKMDRKSKKSKIAVTAQSDVLATRPPPAAHKPSDHEAIYEVQVTDFEYQQVFPEIAQEKQTHGQDEVPTHVTSRNSRQRSVYVMRSLKEKAQHRCEFVSPITGWRCTSRHALQLDEIRPIALGGTNDMENSRVLCSKHNQFAAWMLGLARPIAKESQPAKY